MAPKVYNNYALSRSYLDFCLDSFCCFSHIFMPKLCFGGLNNGWDIFTDLTNRSPGRGTMIVYAPIANVSLLFLYI